MATPPILLRLTVVAATVVALIAAGCLAVPAQADAGAEGDFTARVNDARASRGVAPLKPDAELVSVARRWSARMASDNRVAHNPNLSREVKQNWEKLAENVGAGPTVDEVHRAFMDSSSHRANILDGSFTHIGVGVATSPDGRLWVTQVFMRLTQSGGGDGGGAGGTAAAPATTVRPAGPRPAPAPTAAPAPRAPRTPRPAAPTAPSPAPKAQAPDSPAAAPPPPAPPPVATPRLVLVLETLHRLDSGT